MRCGITECCICDLHYSISVELTVQIFIMTEIRQFFCRVIELKDSMYIYFVKITLPSARQHPSYGDCLEVKRKLLWVGLCDTMNVHSQQHSYMYSSYRSNRLGLPHWDPYAMRRGGCLELYYCNMTEWFW